MFAYGGDMCLGNSWLENEEEKVSKRFLVGTDFIIITAF